MPQHTASIALGANLGRRETQLSQALDLLRATPGVTIAKVSRFIETEPVGGPPDQPKYLNGAAVLKTALTPQELLIVLLNIETQLGRGRTPGVRDEPRRVDLDLLFYDDLILNEPGLTVPHPRLHLRRFVLEPLAEVAPRAAHPVLKQTVAEMLAGLK